MAVVITSEDIDSFLRSATFEEARTKLGASSGGSGSIGDLDPFVDRVPMADGTTWVSLTPDQLRERLGLANVLGFVGSSGDQTDGIISTGSTEPRTLEDRFADVVNVKDFGAVGDGVTDDTAAIQAAIDYIKSIGGVLVIPSGTFACRALTISGATKAFKIKGAGKYSTKLKHLDGAGTFINCNTLVDGVTIEGFEVDCQYSVYTSPSANHGIAVADSNGVTVKDVHITNFKNSAVLIYGSVVGTYKDCLMVDVSADGLGNSANGLLFAEMINSGFVRCTMTGASKDPLIGDPAYGLQFKNDCRRCYMTDCEVSNCIGGVGMGHDGTGQGASECTLDNVRIYDCDLGLVMKGNQRNVYSNFVINMTTVSTTVNHAVDIQEGSIGNSLSNFVIRDIDALKSAVHVRESASDNAIQLNELDEIQVTGRPVSFASGATYNSFRLSRMINPRVRSGGITTMADFATPSDLNSFVYDNYPFQDNLTIALGAIELRNTVNEQIIAVDTEGATASDDLETISAGYTDGQVVRLRTNYDSRDVTVKHGTGNILLNGLTDFTLNNVQDTLTLIWNSRIDRWTECGRGDNS